MKEGKEKKNTSRDGEIIVRPITEEMQQSYLDYAMSVIVSRALPDVRDGMKPVHRRILYTMWKMGLKSTAKYRKSAAIVGEVLGKYHPHGDQAVYDTMVRLAQEFSLRYPLVWGQGNFGSMDGDSPAAMRYTEAKLKKIAEEMLFDIDKDTVDFVDNYDGTQKEPAVLPAKLPNLLLNGTVGIAVGMATNIPPHHLGELVDAIVELIDNPKADVKDLMQHVKGPDFPTGGIIYNQKDIHEAYSTGKGKIATRAKAEIVEEKAGQFMILITEMTYQTNKATLIEKIAQLIRDGKIIGVKALRDESDKDGVRVVVELKKDSAPQKVLNKLYSLTDLQKNFNVNMLALVNGIEPQVMTLKGVLEHYIAHRKNIVTRRAEYELRKAKERAHILEGLKKALDHIDEVIAVIKKSKTREIAHTNLMKKFKLSDIQTTAILEMRLQTLAGLERKKIEDELREKKKLISELESLLSNAKKILGVIKKEILALKEEFNDDRRTKVIKGGVSSFSEEDLVANEDTIITITRDGYIKRMNPSTYKVQRRGGTGVSGGTTREGDVIDHLAGVMTHDNLMFFSTTGKVFQTKAYEIPESSRTSKGNAIVNFLGLSQGEKVTAMIAFNTDDQYKYFFMATRKGIVKKVKIADFTNVRRSGLIAIGLDKDDQLEWVDATTGSDEVVITTSDGQAIRFRESDVRPMGRTASGVRGVKLRKEDTLVGMDVIPKNQKGNQLLIVTENGMGKRSDITSYKVQKRGGSGIKTAKITPKTGKIVAAYIINKADDERDVILTSEKGQIIRLELKTVPTLGRATQGVRIMRARSGDKVAAATVL